MDALAKFDRPDAEIAVADTNDKVVFRQQVKLDGFGAVQATFPVPQTAALGNYTIRVLSGDAIGTGGFEVQEYRKPEFEVGLTPATRFEVQGRDAVVTVQARYYFGQPVANAQVRWVVNQQPYYSPLRWDDDLESGETYWYGDNQTAEGTLRLDADGKGQFRVPLKIDDDGATSARASRPRSPTRRTAKCRPHHRACHLRDVPGLAEVGNAFIAPAAPRRCRSRD